MATTCEFGGEELVEALAANLFADEAAREDDDVGIVVLADEVGNLGTPDEAGANLLMLVERHRDAFAAAAHGDAGIAFTGFDGVGQSMAEGSIVAAFLGVGAVIVILDTLLIEVFLDKLFQRKCCVVAC